MVLTSSSNTDWFSCLIFLTGTFWLFGFLHRVVARAGPMHLLPLLVQSGCVESGCVESVGVDGGCVDCGGGYSAQGFLHKKNLVHGRSLETI